MDKSWRTVLLRVVDVYDLLDVRLGRAQFTQSEQDFPQHLVRLQEEGRVVLVLSQDQHLLS